jgi:hypothetical protein
MPYLDEDLRMTLRPLIAILAIATLPGCQEQGPGNPSSYGLYHNPIIRVTAANGDFHPKPPPVQRTPPSHPSTGQGLVNAAVHAFCRDHSAAACMTYETDAQALIGQCSGFGGEAAHIRASYVGCMAIGFSRGEALSEAFNGQLMSGDEENWITAQVAAEDRQTTDEQFANKITRRCVQWQLPNVRQ